MQTPKDNNAIKIAIIGFGKMGNYHFKAIEQLKEGAVESYYKGSVREILSKLEVCGICDLSTEKNPRIPKIPFYTDYMQLFSEQPVDIAIIATPVGSHFEVSMAALDSGSHIFVEKPMVTRLGDFDTLVNIAELQGLRIMAGHIERYNPVSIKIRQIIADKAVIPKSFKFTRLQPRSPRITDDIITDKLIHDIDLANFFFKDILGFEIIEAISLDEEVQSLKLKVRHNNCSGEIFVSWLEPCEPVRKVIVEWDDMVVFGDFLNKKLTINQRPIECSVNGWIESQNNQIKDELFDFIAHCYAETNDVPAPLLLINEIRDTVSILEQILSIAGSK